MKLPLALLNLRHNVNKTLLSAAGIGTAILLIFIQLGFRGAVENTAVMIYQELEFDCLVRSADYLHFVSANQFPQSVLDEIAGWPEVKHVRPFQVSLGNWLHPDGLNQRGVIVMGVDPDDSPFRPARVNEQLPKLQTSHQVLIDRQTHPEFGPINGASFSAEDVGRSTEVSGKSVVIAGLFNLGTGLTANGAILANRAGFSRLVPRADDQQVSLGLITLRPEVNAAAFVERLQSQFRTTSGQAMVEILTRDAALQYETNRWVGETPIGFIFTLGVLIAFVVGAAIVYMVLASDVANRTSEYATLKAMGYSNGYLNRVVLGQAIYLSLFAFFPAWVLSLGVYRLTSQLANVPIEMNNARVLFVLILSLGMSVISGGLAVRKLWQAQPADLF